MRTAAAIANHELLPKGLHLEDLSIETAHVSIRLASGTSGSRSAHCVRPRGSSRVHSRYSGAPPRTSPGMESP